MTVHAALRFILGADLWFLGFGLLFVGGGRTSWPARSFGMVTWHSVGIFCASAYLEIREAGSDDRQREQGSRRVRPIVAFACPIEPSSRVIAFEQARRHPPRVVHRVHDSVRRYSP